MFAPVTVPVLEVEYTIRQAPEPIRDDEGRVCEVQIDHEDRIIWIAPALPLVDQMRVLPQAVSHCWQERLADVCQTWISSHRVPFVGSTEQVRETL